MSYLDINIVGKTGSRLPRCGIKPLVPGIFIWWCKLFRLL